MPSLTLRAAPLLALLSAAPIAAQMPPRGVYLPPAPGYVIGHQARAGRQLLVELVPNGQSVTNFTKMISLQTVPGAGRMTSVAFIEGFARKYQQSCPRSVVTPITLIAARGVRIDCPRHPNTGRTETVFARAISTGPDMALAHITLKYVPLPAESQWARSYLARVGMK